MGPGGLQPGRSGLEGRLFAFLWKAGLLPSGGWGLALALIIKHLREKVTHENSPSGQRVAIDLCTPWVATVSFQSRSIGFESQANPELELPQPSKPL